MPCWTPEQGDIGSKSTVSKDMMTGYMWGWLAVGQAPPLQRLADYGVANDWVMGLPTSRPQEVELGDNLTGALCRAIYVLTDGADNRSHCRGKTSVYLPVFQDYERHVQTLGILLQGEVDAGRPFVALDIDGEMLKRLKENVDYDASDALFQAALGVYTGDYDTATRLLLDQGYQCPSYVRGAASYCAVHKAFAAYIILKHTGGL